MTHDHPKFTNGDLYAAAAATLPEIADSEWRWLWHNGYYDGVLTGMALHKGEQLYAKVIDECDDASCGFYRRYVLIRLYPQLHAEELRRHELFRKHVGTHCDYDENGKRGYRGLKRQEEWHHFYDAQKEWLPFEPAGELIGLIKV